MKSVFQMKRLTLTLFAVFVATYGAWAQKTTIDLSTVTSNITVQNGDVLTGTLGNNVKISIADGATVTLSNMSINAGGLWADFYSNYAGLTCEGDATIILADETTNTVWGFAEGCPGIFVPENKLLTIKGETLGTGSLIACSSIHGNAAGIGAIANYTHCGNIKIDGGYVTASCNKGSAAGIGGAYYSNCGNITITGGTVIASSGHSGAGIGSGVFANCGDITITGGTVTASNGLNAAGIGCGNAGNCGNITITNDVVKVTAIKGSSADYSIGPSFGGQCGTVTINGVTGFISDSPFVFSPLHPITLKEGTEDAEHWIITPNTASVGDSITVRYTGNKKIKSIKAFKK
jgi:hypothetical protein